MLGHGLARRRLPARGQRWTWAGAGEGEEQVKARSLVGGETAAAHEAGSVVARGQPSQAGRT